LLDGFRSMSQNVSEPFQWVRVRKAHLCAILLEQAMSDYQESPAPSNGKELVFGVVGVAIAGVCLLVCAGLLAMGFVVPVVARQKQRQLQVERAEVEAQRAAAQARAKQQAATATAERAANEEADQPQAGDAPASDRARIEDDNP
jgi:hypothetical protein